MYLLQIWCIRYCSKPWCNMCIANQHNQWKNLCIPMVLAHRSQLHLDYRINQPRCIDACSIFDHQKEVVDENKESSCVRRSWAVHGYWRLGAFVHFSYKYGSTSIKWVSTRANKGHTKWKAKDISRVTSSRDKRIGWNDLNNTYKTIRKIHL